MARSTFYYHLKASQRTDKYAELKSIIKNIFKENKGRYGYSRITVELSTRGYTVSIETYEFLWLKV